MVHLMHKMVGEVIVKRVQAAKLFSISADETTDKAHAVNLAIGVRYIHNGVAEERVLSIVDLAKRDGDFVSRVVLNQLETWGLSHNDLLSQTHDGASVMSGKKKGVQAHISSTLGREIPYIHCFAHQLHLVVVWAMKECVEVGAFFETMRALTNFLKLSSARKVYQGGQLPRLLEHRWSGHHDTVAGFIKFQADIKSALEELRDSSHTDTSSKTLAAGLLHTALTPKNVFVATVLEKVFAILDPLNHTLQSPKLHLEGALHIISTTESRLRSLLEAGCSSWLPGTPKQKKMRLVHGDQSTSLGDVEQDGERRELTEIFHAIVEAVIAEMNERFSERNVKLLACLAFMKPGPDFLDADKLEPLTTLAARFFPPNTSSSKLDQEISVAKGAWEDKNPVGSEYTFQDAAKFFLGPLYSVAFPRVTILFKMTMTFGSSSADLERGFSTLTRILSSSRLSMTQTRKEDLVLLSVHSDITNGLDMEEFVNRFAEKARRLKLTVT